MTRPRLRIRLGFAALLLVLGSTALAQERTYHVCKCGPGAEAACVPGDDLDAGTEQAPLRTLERARQLFPTLRNGDSIRLCRGGAWQLGNETGTRWENNACRRVQAGVEPAPCEIGNYDPPWGGLSKPYVQRVGSEAVLELVDAAQHADDHLRLRGLRLSRAGVAGDGLLIHPSRNFVDLVDMEIDAHEVGVSLPPEDCFASGTRCAYNYRRLLASGGEWAGQRLHALRGEGSPALSVELDTLRFRRNGSIGGSGGDVFLSDVGGANVLHSSFSQTADAPGRLCHANAISVERVISFNLKGNLFEERAEQVADDCMPVRYFAGNGAGVNLLVGNRFNEFGQAALQLSNCSDCFIQNNVLVRSVDRGGVGIVLSDENFSAASHGVWFRHNSMFIASAAPFVAIALRVRTNPLLPPGHLSVSSNAVFYAGASADFRCWVLQAERSSFGVVDYNHCHFPVAEAAGARWGDFLGAPPTKRSAFEAGMGSPLEVWWSEVNANNADPPWDRHSTTEDPGFGQSLDPYARLGLMPRFATDSAVDRGEPFPFAYITTDFRGRARDALPDAGAFEYDAGAFADLLFATGFE